MAPHQSFEMPASYMNTILALNHYAPFYRAQALHDAVAQQTEPPAHQAVNAPVQRHIRFSTIRFTTPSASSVPAMWRRNSINTNRHRQRREYSWSDSTASTTEYFKGRTDDISTPPGRFPKPCSSPNCSRRRHDSSQDSASVHEYFRGHTDDRGLALGRRRTPYPSRDIAGVSWTSTTSCTSFLESASRRGWSWSEGDDLPYTAATAARVALASDTTGYKSVLERVPTPYPRP